LPCAGYDGHDPETELVDQVVSQEHVVEAAGAVLDEVLAGVTLARAQAGDGEAFRELIDPYGRELQAHCYRILRSVQDAEDVLQEALLAAWRSIGRFDGRSLRAWLYRIATNRCLNYLRSESRRPQSAGLPDQGAGWTGLVRAVVARALPG